MKKSFLSFVSHCTKNESLSRLPRHQPQQRSIQSLLCHAHAASSFFPKKHTSSPPLRNIQHFHCQSSTTRNIFIINSKTKRKPSNLNNNSLPKTKKYADVNVYSSSPSTSATTVTTNSSSSTTSTSGSLQYCNSNNNSENDDYSATSLNTIKTQEIPSIFLNQENGGKENTIGAHTATTSETEVKDAKIIFGQVINTLEHKYGRHNLTFPKEIYFLIGAPGSGKGTMARHIVSERGLTVGPMVASDLLNSKEFQEMKDRGQLVSDKTVVELVFDKLLSQEFVNGVVVDGFPRTTIQAECISMLYDFMHNIRKEFLNTEYGENFRRPCFRITVLFVDEQVSIERQLKRGLKVKEQNRIAKETGIGNVDEERATDMNVEAAKKRYKYFKEHIYESIKLLKQKFHYNLVDASGPIERVASNIIDEFKYQSSMELGKETFDAVSRVPPSEELIIHARQQLVRRLDSYWLRHNDLFRKVLYIIETEFLHILHRQALTGVAIIRSQNELFSTSPLALNMVLDILTERGYQVILDYEKKIVPFRVKPDTNEIEHKNIKVYHFQILFEKPKIRN